MSPRFDGWFVGSPRVPSEVVVVDDDVAGGGVVAARSALFSSEKDEEVKKNVEHGTTPFPDAKSDNSDNDKEWEVFMRGGTRKVCPRCKTVVGTRRKQCPICSGFFVKLQRKVTPKSDYGPCVVIGGDRPDVLGIISVKSKTCGYLSRCFVITGDRSPRCLSVLCSRLSCVGMPCEHTNVIENSPVEFGEPLRINLDVLNLLISDPGINGAVVPYLYMGDVVTPVVQMVARFSFCVIATKDDTETKLPFVHSNFYPPSDRTAKSLEFDRFEYRFACDCIPFRRRNRRGKIRKASEMCPHYFLVVAAILTSETLREFYNAAIPGSNDDLLTAAYLDGSEELDDDDDDDVRSNSTIPPSMAVGASISCDSWEFSEWFTYLIKALNYQLNITVEAMLTVRYTIPMTFARILSKRANEFKVDLQNLNTVHDLKVKARWRFAGHSQIQQFFTEGSVRLNLLRYNCKDWENGESYQVLLNENDLQDPRINNETVCTSMVVNELGDKKSQCSLRENLMDPQMIDFDTTFVLQWCWDHQGKSSVEMKTTPITEFDKLFGGDFPKPNTELRNIENVEFPYPPN